MLSEFVVLQSIRIQEFQLFMMNVSVFVIANYNKFMIFVCICFIGIIFFCQ